MNFIFIFIILRFTNDNLMQEELFETLNVVRCQPHYLMDEIKGQLSRFQTRHVYRTRNETKLRSLSGKEAWEQCIMSLERQKTKPPLQWNKLLEQAAERCAASHSPHQVLQEVCSFTGAFTLHRAQYDPSQDVKEIVAAMMVGDGDDKKEGRIAIFHPSYMVFGCYVQKQGSKVTIVSLFAQQVSPPKVKTGKEQINTPKKIASQIMVDSRQKGKIFMQQLNKIRKDPKNYIHTLKKNIDKFKDQNTLITQYATIIFKEGQTSLYEFISQLQTQYPLPSVRESIGLVAVSQFQSGDLLLSSQRRTPHQTIIQRFCSQAQGVKSFRVRDVKQWPIDAILMRMLLDDGDKKRTARRKLMSPICKAGGCAITDFITVVNIGEYCHEKKQIVANFLSPISPPCEKVSKISPNKFEPIEFNKINNNNEERVVVKRTKKRKKGELNGRQCWITETQTIFATGEVQNEFQEQLIR